MAQQHEDLSGELEPFLGDPVASNNYGSVDNERTSTVGSQIGRIRSNSARSIRSTYEIVKENFDKRKFFISLIASFVLYLGFVGVFAPRTSLARDLRRIHSSHLTESEIFRIYLNSLNDKNLAGDHVRNYTSRLHGIGDKGSLDYTVQQLRSLGFDPKLSKYYPWTNEPIDTQVSVIKNSEVIFIATMLEECLPEDPTTCHEDNVRGYHGYSANGNVTAQYIFSNYGTLEDYRLLLEGGIDIEGKIHIIRYGKLYPGLKVKNAELYGAAGVIMYTDPYEDGFVTTRNGFEMYPKGPARHESSIERASVGYFSEFPGDPTTPNYASKYRNTERMSPAGKMPNIPSVPLSSREVAPLLEELNGRGINMQPGGNIREFDYFSGPSPENTKVHICNNQSYQITEMANIVVEIPGIFSEYDIIIGNHRDSWTLGGAGSPNSGSAVFLEIARGLSSLLKHGWKPLRPIKLISWDGGASGILGSTEYVEDHSQLLKKNALAYLNLDVAVTGSEFSCQANPLLHQVIKRAAKFTQYKNDDDWTLFEEWKQASSTKIDSLDGVADYSPFQFHMGVPSAQFQFKNDGANDAIHHLHSSYDTYTWIQQFVDEDYKLHNTLAALTGMTTLMLSEMEPADFSVSPYFKEISKWYGQWHSDLLHIFSNDSYLHSLAGRVSQILSTLGREAAAFDSRILELNQLCTQDFPAWQFYKKFRIYIKMVRTNNKLRQIDRLFLTQKGLSGRDWMKHSIFAPDKNTGYTVDVLPGLHEAIQEKDRDNVVEWLNIFLAQFENIRSLLQ